MSRLLRVKTGAELNRMARGDQVNRILMTLAASAVLGFATTAHAADVARPARFGNLEGLTADAAKAKAAAWLKESGKTDAATTARFDKIWAEDVSVLDRVV